MSKTYKDRKPTSDPKTWKMQKAPRSDRNVYPADLFQRLVDEYEEMVEDDDGEFFEGLKNETGDQSSS